jgi:hypothetical protein
VLVCRSATANHLCEEFYDLQCITSYRRINQQNGLSSAANRKGEREKEKKEIFEFGNTTVVPV